MLWLDKVAPGNAHDSIYMPRPGLQLGWHLFEMMQPAGERAGEWQPESDRQLNHNSWQQLL